MSQTCDLNIFFVLPNEDIEAEYSKDMYDAFDCVKLYRGKPQWVLPSFCLTRTPQPNDVFVFEKFKGEAFLHLKKNSAKYVLLGPRCMLTCLSGGDPVPSGTSPVFTEGMRDLVVCCTGFDQATKKKLQEKIEYMGGTYDVALRSITTHVVALNTMSCKAQQASISGKGVMVKEWVDAVWKQSQESNVRGNDEQFYKYRCSLFHNIRATSSGIPKKEKEKLSQLITSNGGSFSGVLGDAGTDLLLIKLPEGEKYNAAKKWKISCVKPSWVYRCIELGKVVPIKSFEVEGPVKKASTPKKDDVTLSANFSLMSAISADEKHYTHLEETCNVTDMPLSQNTCTPAKLLIDKSTANRIIDSVFSNIRESGQFLDGCNVYIAGIQAEYFEKLKKILNAGGATRFDELSSSVTHIIVSGTISNVLRETGAHLLPLEWLAESAKLKKPAPVDAFLLEKNSSENVAPPSPLSKQGALLLARPEPKRLEMDPVPVLEEEPVEDLLERYNHSQQGEPLEQLANEKPPLTPSRSTPCTTQSGTPLSRADFFSGLRFFLSSDLVEEELIGSEDLISNAGGIVVPKKFAGISDYAVVPLAAKSLSQVTAKEVVNVFFLKDCTLENTIVPIQYFHLPMTWVQGSTPLNGCVMSVSKYLGSERDFVASVIVQLGAVLQEILARKPKGAVKKTTHLICPEASGLKYSGALRWGVPVVHQNWLIQCAELGERISVEPFLVGSSKLSITASSNGSLERTNQITTPGPAKQGQIPNGTKGENINHEGHSPTERVGVHQSSKKVLFINTETPGTTKQIGKTDTTEVNTGENCNPETSSSEPDYSKRPERKLLENVENTVGKTPLEMSLHRGLSQVTLTDKFDSYFPSPVNKPLERIKHFGTPSSSPDPNRTMTPTSPIGAFLGNPNPSPTTRKRLWKWIHQGADFPVDPPRAPAKKEDNVIGDLLTKQLQMMTRRCVDVPLDDSPVISPAKKHCASEPGGSSVRNEVLKGLNKMREIEDSYSKTVVAKVQSPTRSLREEHKMLVVAESQPHTEVGWDDPSEKDLALSSLERCCENSLPARPPKIFMMSGLTEIEVESAKKLILESQGKLADGTFFDKKATHLIGSETITRAEKLMGSIAAGLWVLHPSYLKTLERVKNVNEMVDEEFEWGNPNLPFPKHNLQRNVKECMEAAYHWRIDVQIHKKPPPFHNSSFIIALGSAKKDSFKRLIEAGGGKVVVLDSTVTGPNVYCISDLSRKGELDLRDLSRRNIPCVTSLFISDIILRKPSALRDNLL